MDYQAFRAFLLVDEAKAPITVDTMLERLHRAVERGFAIDTFLLGPDAAEKVGRDYLSQRRHQSTVWAYNNDVKGLQALLRWQKWERQVRFKSLPIPRAQLRALKEHEVRTLLDYHAHDPESDKMHRALLLTVLKTGMRASEVAAMNVSDLDTEGNRIFVRKPAKGGLKRWLPVESWVFSPKRPLGAWLNARPQPKNDPDALWTTTFRSRSGKVRNAPKRLSPDGLRVCLYKIGAASGIHINFNIARHTRATELRKRGWDLLYIRTYLGHSSVKSTEVYAEVQEEDVNEVMRRKPGRDFFNDSYGE